jgi:hypothetical protein
MNAKIDRINGAIVMQLLGNNGNPVNVLLGGSDGTLVTIDLKGKIKVIPPEGPGDPELRKEFKHAVEHLMRLGGFIPMACDQLAIEIGNVIRQIEQNSGYPPGSIQSLERTLESLQRTYEKEGCNKASTSTQPKRGS